MDRKPSIRDNIALHVSNAARPGAESGRLARDLSAMYWPGGVADHTEPMARGWLSLWGPELMSVETPVCRCSEDRCDICN